MSEQISKTDARQGRGGKRVFTILLASLALCAIFLVVFTTYGFKQAEKVTPPKLPSTLSTP